MHFGGGGTPFPILAVGPHSALRPRVHLCGPLQATPIDDSGQENRPDLPKHGCTPWAVGRPYKRKSHSGSRHELQRLNVVGVERMNDSIHASSNDWRRCPKTRPQGHSVRLAPMEYEVPLTV